MTWLLLIAAALVVIGAVGVVTERLNLTVALLVVPLVAIVLIWTGLTIAPAAPDGPFGQTQIMLTDVGFAPAVGESITIGGDAAADDLIIAPAGVAAQGLGRGRLPASFLTIRRVDPQTIELHVNPQPSGASVAVVHIGDKDGVFLNASQVDVSARACTSDCARAPKLERTRKLKVYAAEVTPLIAGGGTLRARGGFYFTDAAGHLLEFGAPGAPSETRLRNGEHLTISIYEAAPGAPQRGSLEGRPGDLILRRTLELSYSAGKIQVHLQTPQTRVLALSQGQEGRPVIRLAPGSAASEAPSLREAVAIFPLLGAPFDAQLDQVRFDAARDSDGVSRLYAPDGAERDFRGPVTVGDTHQVTVLIRPLDFRSGVFRWVGWAAGILLLGGLAATWTIRRQDPFASLGFAVLDLLLSMRLLISIEGAFVDASAKAQDAVSAALIALPLGSLLLLSAHPRAGEQKPALGILTALSFVAVALTFAASGQLDSMAILAGLAWVAALTRGPARFMSHIDKYSRWPAATAIGGSVALVLIRFITLLTNTREGLPLPWGRLALSLFFVPATLLCAAPLMAAAQRGWANKRQAILHAAALGVLLILGVGVASGLVHDNGFAVYALPVMTAAVLAYASRPAQEGVLGDLLIAAVVAGVAVGGLYLWTLGFAPAALALALVGIIGLAALLFHPRAVWLAPAATVGALLLLINVLPIVGYAPSVKFDLAQAARVEDNNLRLFSVLAPKRLADAGTSGAEAMEDTNAHMSAYGATFLGRGYFNLPTPTALAPYHLTDNVSAVHLISPFGRLGAFAFLLAPGALALAACALAARRGLPSSWLGAMAALSLAQVSIYMVLANLLAAPFTGRNVYLLAATSGSDLLEGLLLMGLALAMLGSRKETSA